jgi:signal transduction histidine kinase/CheY-like chemotaxis protein
MENLLRETPKSYIETVYSYIRSSIFHIYLSLVVIKTVILCFTDINDLETFLDILIPTLAVALIMLILILESYNVSRKVLLLIFSEMINITCYLYACYVSRAHKEIYLILSVVCTCGLQLVGKSRVETNLLIFKLIFWWYILPILKGEIEIPYEQSPYLTTFFIFAVLTTVFTIRRLKEDEFIRALATIHNMKAQLFNIIQAMPESVLIFSENHDVLFFNRESQNLFQTDQTDRIKFQLQNMSYTDDSSEAPQNRFYHDILNYLESGEDRVTVFGVIELNGRPYEWRGTKSEWDHSKILILTAADVTTIISYERIKAEVESKTILLRTVSHEIRTPTSTIVTLSEALKEAELEEEVKNKVSIINISSKLLLSLINDLLDFSRLIADSFSITKCEVKLRDLIEETYKLFVVQAEQKNLVYRYIIDPLLPEIIITDPNRLRQVIVNLISNSLKFTLCGSIKLEAILTDKSTMLIKVSDTGLGIPQSKIKNLFDPFFSNQDKRLNPQGCGLGLYISNKFAQLLGGGPIQVESKLHEGSAFYFDVDIGMDKRISFNSSEEELRDDHMINERSFETVPRNMITHSSFIHTQAEILIADDNIFNLLVMRNFLTSTGYRFEEARTGLEAVKKVKEINATKDNIKVIVMDLEMPEMTGIEATKEIINLYNLKQIAYAPAIIGYTADDSEERTQQCEEAGMKECLSKSSSKNAFLSLMKRYLSE